MTNPATIARDNASHCEAKKHALRQTQDGIVVAFVLHPNDVPPALQLAPLGTRYMLAFVEVGDDETPVERKEAKQKVALPAQAPAPGPPSVRAQRVPREWHELAPAMQAGIRCNEPAFVKFLQEKGDDAAASIQTTDQAAEWVRTKCGVKTRADILPNTPGAAIWHSIDSHFQAWMQT